MDANLLRTAGTFKSSQEGHSKGNRQHFWLYCESYWVGDVLLNSALKFRLFSTYLFIGYQQQVKSSITLLHSYTLEPE